MEEGSPQDTQLVWGDQEEQGEVVSNMVRKNFKSATGFS